jgi:hypothetical protein
VSDAAAYPGRERRAVRASRRGFLAALLGLSVFGRALGERLGVRGEQLFLMTRTGGWLWDCEAMGRELRRPYPPDAFADAVERPSWFLRELKGGR